MAVGSRKKKSKIPSAPFSSSFLSAFFAFAYFYWSCNEAKDFLSCLSVISGLCCSKKHFAMNPFVKALYKYICLDLWSRNVTNATKANEPILCQLKCHSENLSYHKSSVSWGEITEQKWKCHCGISSQLTGPSVHLSAGCFNTQYILENPLYIEIACLLCQSLEYADNILSRLSYKTDRLYNSLKDVRILHQMCVWRPFRSKRQ